MSVESYRLRIAAGRACACRRQMQVRGHGQGGEDDGQVGLDRLTQMVEHGLCRCSGYADVVVVMPARAGYASPEGRHGREA